MIKKIKVALLLVAVYFVVSPVSASAYSCFPIPLPGCTTPGLPGVDFGGSGGGINGGWSTGNVSGYGLPEGSITGIIENILVWLLMMFGIIGIIGFVISGLMYVLAAGDEKTIEKAKSAMKNSAIGVIVGISGFVIIKAVDTILNAYSGV
ncbi:MAG: hypothetical protein Q7T51_01520 [Candidatus Moranbacteria bacterium]|nr:hypothetical protein [Candidatus Moranbacteria bacterium]